MSRGSTIEAAQLVAAYRLRGQRRLLFLLLSLALLLACLIWDIASGPAGLSFAEVAATLFSPDSAEVENRIIVWKLRLPVALMAVLVGAMLAVAGAEMQTILNNPLADPFTLGLSSAASFGAAVGIVYRVSLFPWAGEYVVTVNAFVMALVASMGLYLFTRLRGMTAEAMVLVGIAMLFSFNSLLALLQYGATDVQLAQIIFWMLGSLARATWEKVAICAVVLGAVMAWFMRLSWSLTALRMGDEKAASLGVNVTALRLAMLTGISLLAAVAVSFVGAIAFVGLVGPHLARMLVGEEQRSFMPVSALAGAMIMSGTSIVSKSLVPGVIYPVGIITSLIGIPFFVFLIITRRQRMWD